jgi:hypothetical protein
MHGSAAAVVPIVHRNADLDQPVRGERAVHLSDELRCDSRVAHPHDRVQRMRAGLQAGALCDESVAGTS